MAHSDTRCISLRLFFRVHPIKPLFVGVVFEQLCISAPVNQSLELPFSLWLRKMLVQDIYEKLLADSAVLLSRDRLHDGGRERHARQQLLLEDLVATVHSGGSKLFAGVRDRHVAMCDYGKAQHG